MSDLDLDAPISQERLSELEAKRRENGGIYLSRKLTTADVIGLIAAARELERLKSALGFLEVDNPVDVATELGWKPDAKGLDE